jgi:threonyl-tRNA synthetase
MAEEAATAKMAELDVNGAGSWADVVEAKKPYYAKRIELFEMYAARERSRIEEARQRDEKIAIILPDGATKQGVKGATTPMDIANEISKGLAKKVLVAKVDGEAWDLLRPLEGDCTLSLHSFDDPEGKDVSGRNGCVVCVL